MEEWKDIKGYEGIYQVSSEGRVWSNVSKKYLGGHNSVGYMQVNLGGGDVRLIHRLVAEAFIPNEENKPCVDHINTLKDDNRIENLRWVTYQENNINQLTIQHISEAQKKRFENSEEREHQRIMHIGMHKGEKHPMYGKHHTEEARKKLSEANKGKKQSSELIQKRMLKIMKPILQYDKDNNLIKEWTSSKNASVELNIDTSSITACCRGRLRTAGGYIWKYKNDQPN